MIKNFLFKQVLKSQLKDAPKDQQEMILKVVEEKPELFRQIAEEIQQKVKHENMDQMKAAMLVMKNHQQELQKVLGK